MSGCPECADVERWRDYSGGPSLCSRHARESAECRRCEDMNRWNDITQSWRNCGRHR